MSRAPKAKAATNTPAESPAKPQGAAGGVAAPEAAGGGAESPAAVAVAEVKGQGAADNPSVAVTDAAPQPDHPELVEAVQAAAEAGQPAARDAARTEQGAPRVILLCNVDHDGARLAEGAEVTLPADVVERLRLAGAARLAD